MLHHVAGLVLIALLASCAPGLEPVRLRVPPEQVGMWTRGGRLPRLSCGERDGRVRRVHRVWLVEKSGKRIPVPKPARVMMDSQTMTISSRMEAQSLHLSMSGLDFAEIDARIPRVRSPLDWVLDAVAVTALTAFVGAFYLFASTTD